MADGKVKIEVHLDGADGAAQGVEKLRRAVEELGGAQTRETGAAQAATAAVNANSAAHGQNAGATDKATKSLQGNTQAQKENAKAAQKLREEMGVVVATQADIAKATGAAGNSLKDYEGFSKNAGKAIGGLNLANQAFVRLMQGDVVGAFKMATMAAKEFFAAIVANPILLAIAGVAAALAGVVKIIQKARDAHREVVEEAKRWKEVAGGIQGEQAAYARERDNPAAPPKAASDMGDAELERELAQAKQARQKAEHKVNRQAKAAENAAAAGADVFGEYSEEEYNQAKEERKAALDRERELQAEKNKRIRAEKDARRQEREDAAASAAKVEEGRKELARQQRYDAIEDKEGKAASLKAQHADTVEAWRREADPEKRLDLEKEMYRLAREYKAELDRQAETKARLEEQTKQQAEREKEQAEAEKKRRKEAQEDWERSRRLRQMDAAERVKALEAEKAALKKGPRNAETEAKMRRTIDELDRAKADAKSEAEKAAKDAAAGAASATSEAEARTVEMRGGFRQFKKWGEDGGKDGEAGKKRGGIRKSAAQRAAEARRADYGAVQADRLMRRTGLTQWHTSSLAPRGGWLLGKKEGEKKSPEAEATERGNAILEEIREALK